MQLTLIKKQSAASDIDSGAVKAYQRLRKNDGMYSVQIGWEGVTVGGVAGTLKIYYSNDPSTTKEWHEVASYDVNSAADTTNLKIDMPVLYLKAVYTANTVTVGDVYAYAAKGNI